MKRLTGIVVLSLLAVMAAAGADSSSSNRAVLPPARRLEALKDASRMLEARQATWKAAVADLPDPFFRTTFVPKIEEATPEPVARAERPDLEVLQLAAEQIRPTGTMMVDGENYLLMGGKRHKAGAMLPVTIDGIVYQILITAIDGKSYVLRLNEQELRQQLK